LIIFILGLAFLGVLCFFPKRYRLAKWSSIFSETARRLRLDFDKGTSAAGLVLRGELNGFPVRISLVKIEQGRYMKNALSISVQFPSLRTRLAIIPAQSMAGLGLTAGSDIELHDRIFDQIALVEAPDRDTARALLHPEARRIIAQLINKAVNKEFMLGSSSLTTAQKTDDIIDSAQLCAGLKKVIGVVTLLTRPGSTKALLAENYRAEKDSDAQVACFESYAAAARSLTAKDQVVESALRSSDRRLAFAAARAIGRPGYQYLPRLFAKADHTLTLEILDYARQKKIKSLIPYFMDDNHLPDDRAALNTLVDFLCDLDDPRVEIFFQRQIARAVDIPAHFRKVCLHALGERGTLDSIKFLYGLKDSLPQNEIAAAIAAIRNRLGAGQDGLLSLSGPEDDGGRLSLTEEPSAGKKTPG
jgi:hypothetical protein